MLQASACLAFRRGEAILDGRFRSGPSAFFDELVCDGSEESVLECEHYALTDGDGSCGRKAGVQCCECACTSR